MVEIYTDGACSKNGSKDNFGGYSAVVVKNNHISVQYCKAKRNTTNNEMELMGVLTAIQMGKLINEKQRQEIKIFTDSSYVTNTINLWMSSWANNNWIKASNKKPPENLELIKKIFNLMEFERNIKVIHIKGHANSEYNNLADSLAVQARKDEEQKYILEMTGGSNDH